MKTHNKEIINNLKNDINTIFKNSNYVYINRENQDVVDWYLLFLDIKDELFYMSRDILYTDERIIIYLNKKLNKNIGFVK